MAHTPGPWWVAGNETDVLANIPGFDSVWKIAACRVPEPILGGIETFPSKENAKLIASAPTMYAEIQRLRSHNAELLAACKAALERVETIRRLAPGVFTADLMAAQAQLSAAIAAAEQKGR